VAGRLRDNEWELLSSTLLSNKGRHALTLLRSLLTGDNAAAAIGSERDPLGPVRLKDMKTHLQTRPMETEILRGLADSARAGGAGPPARGRRHRCPPLAGPGQV